MPNIVEQRDSFFYRAKLKFSNMQEDWVLSGKKEEDFFAWFDTEYADMDVYEVVAHLLECPRKRIPNKDLFLGVAYKTKKELLSCAFAKSLYNQIIFKQKC